MGLTVTEDTPADMLAGNMELLVQLPPRIDEDYENDEIYDGDDDDDRHQHLRNNHRHHNHHHSNGHHTRRNVNGNARRVTVARNTPMMDLLVQVATSQKLSASSYTLEAIGEHGLVLTHHPNTPIGALDALQVKLLPKQGTFVPMKTRHANQPFETTFRLQVHLPRNQLYVSRVSSRMNLGKILDDVCTEKNLDRNNYELRHPANIEEILDLSLSLQDYHLQEVTLCPKRRSMGSSLSSQDIMALQRQEERRRQEAKQSVFGFVFKKSKESSLSTDSLGERSVSPARSDGTGRSSSPQAPPTAPTRPQRKRRPAPKPPMPQPPAVPEINGGKIETEKDERIVISHSRNSSDSSGYHEASVLSDNLDSNIRVPETLPRRSKLQTPTPRESPGRTLAETSQASKSLGNLAAVIIPTPRTTIARGNSNSSLVSAGLRKKKAAPPPPQTRPLSSAISTQALERIVDSEESLSSSIVEESEVAKISSDVAVPVKQKLVVPRTSLGNDDQTLEVKPKIDVNLEEDNIQGEKSAKSHLSGVENSQFKIDPSISNSEIIVPNVEPASEHKHKRANDVAAPVPKPRGSVVSRLENVASSALYKNEQNIFLPSPEINVDQVKIIPEIAEMEYGSENKVEHFVTLSNDIPDLSPTPSLRLRTKNKNKYFNNVSDDIDKIKTEEWKDIVINKPPIKPRRKTLENSEVTETKEEVADIERRIKEENLMKNMKSFSATSVKKTEESHFSKIMKVKEIIKKDEILSERKENFISKINLQPRRENKIEFEVNSLESLEHSSIISNENSNDVKRSCAVISTVPKCDHFDCPKTRLTISDDGSDEYSLASSLGSSFGVAGKSMLESSYQNDLKSSGTPSMITEFTNSEDELDVENFEMFERSRNTSKLLLRSNSELNNFEINTIEGNGRHPTSRSVDYTFALNPNLSRNISDLSNDSYPNKNYSKNKSSNFEETKTFKTTVRTPATKLPAFLTNNITWERPELLQDSEDRSNGRVAWSLGESDLGEEYQGSITEAESTSDLLKKVSDTLSGSLRSPTTPTTTIASSLANGDQSPLLQETSNAECVDGAKEPGDIGLEIDEAQRFLVANEKLDNNDKDCEKREKESSNFLNDSQTSTIKHSDEQTASLLSTKQNINSNEDHLSSTTNDWEYLLPEPPTEFRDTNVVANKDVISSNSYEKIIPITTEVAKSKAESKSIEKQATPVVETVKSKKNETVLTSSDESNRSRTSSISFSETAIKLPSDQRRVTRSFTKSSVDSESRRGSQTVSTPSIAPVDNTLSNFVITTYSRPKNVDIFDEIDRTSREPQIIASPKNSTQNLHRPSVVNADSKKNSTISLLNDTTPRVVNQEDKSKFSGIISQLEVQKNNNEESVDNVNRSDMKISIAAKPRPKSEIIINENVNRSKFIVVNNVINDSCDSKEEIKPIEETIVREQGGGNQKFSQWRQDILKKQETPTKEKQLQSLQVLRSILPQLEENRRDSEEPIIVSEKPKSNHSEEPRVETTISNTVATPTEPNLQHAIQKTPSSDEPQVKRYTYAGPPAIDLGSWSDRSRTTKVQIKPDSDYKFEKSRSPELSVKRDAEFSNRENHLIVNNKITTGMTTTVTLNSVKPAADHSTFSPNNVNSNTIIKNQRIVDTKIEKNLVDDKKDLITRTNVGGVRRPVSMIVGSSSGMITLRSTKDDITMSKLGVEKENLQKQRDGLKEENDDVDVDVRPRNFKELKEAFAKDQNMNNSITIPKYGTLGRRMENSTITNNKSTTTIVRRDSNVTLNGENIAANLPRKDQTDSENSIKIIKPVQDKRNFVIPAATPTTNRCGLQDVVGAAVRRTSRGNLMPVVKGFKMTVQAEDETSLSQDKRGGCRVAIGDISNGNYITTQNTLKKTVQTKVVDDFGSSNVIPKPPPTMPVITGVTLKSNNLKNSRPKSMPVEPDPRNQLLESIRNFAAGNQLKRIPRRNPNIAGAPGSRSVR